MRTKPLIGRKAWFGPRRMGPVTAEGWAVVVTGTVAAVVPATLDRRSRWLAPVLLAAVPAITFLKGTSPGGSGAWQEFQASRDSNRGN